MTSATTITATVSAPSPPATGVTELVGAAKKNAIAAALKPKPVRLSQRRVLTLPSPRVLPENASNVDLSYR